MELKVKFFSFLLQCTAIYGCALKQETKKNNNIFSFSFFLSLKRPLSPPYFAGQLADGGANKIHIKPTKSDTHPLGKHRIGPPAMPIHQTHITKHKTQTYRDKVERKIEATPVQIPYNHHKTQTHGRLIRVERKITNQWHNP